MAKSIIIIGAGIAGLSTACYAEMNGYETLIFELHNKPGGLCTSWKRKDYTFDFCIHNLTGTGDVPGKKLWEELGALEDVEILDYDVFVRVEDTTGTSLNVYTDLDRFEDHLKNIAPEDTKLIEEYINACRSLTNTDLFSILGGLESKLKILPHIFSLLKWSRITLEEFSSRFKNEFLQKTFPHIQYNFNSSQLPMLISLIFIAGLSNGDLGWPKMGSFKFSKNIEKHLLDLGGEIIYRSEVKKIIVQDNKAVGVMLADGSEHYADLVVSAADGHSTIYKMLDGKYTNKLIDSYYQSYLEEQDFGLQIYLGVNMDLSMEPHAITLLLDNPVTIEEKERDSLYLEIFKSNTGLVKEGKSVIKVVNEGNYEYWKNLHSNMEKYNKEKENIYHTIVEILEKRFPGITEQIETYDVTTPVTVERFTHNFHGWQPWGAKEGSMKIMMGGLSKTLPDLRNFYMVGQWAGAMIGISNAALTGRNLIKELCKKDKKKFITK